MRIKGHHQTQTTAMTPSPTLAQLTPWERNMKTKTIMTLSLLAVVLGLASIAFSQSGSMTAEQYRQYEGSGKEQRDSMPKWRDDKDDRDWGIADWRTRKLTKIWHEKFGYVLYEPKTLYEWREDTRQVFAKIDAKLTTKEQKDFSAACQKMRDAGIILEACGGGFCKSAPEVRHSAYTGPFFSKEGPRGDYFMAQILYVRAHDNYVATGEEYLKVFAKTSEKAQAEVAMALYTVRGKTYEIDRYKLAMQATGKPPMLYSRGYGFSACTYEYQKNQEKIGKEKEAIENWKAAFKTLTDTTGKIWKSSSPNSPGYAPKGCTRHDLTLVMDPGSVYVIFDDDYTKMIARDDFLFIWRQADEAWKNLLNPSEETLTALAGVERLSKDMEGVSSKEEKASKYKDWLANKPVIFTYWRRDADPGKPSLVLKVGVLIPSGNVGTVMIHNHLPNSFLKGLSPEWRQELADFEKNLPKDGVSVECIKSWHAGELIGRGSDADKKWRAAMNKEEDELYARYFAKDRLKWHPISAEEYAKLNAEQLEWVKTHPDSGFERELKLCASFEKLSPIFNPWDTANGTVSPQFSLESIETSQEAQAVAGK